MAQWYILPWLPEGADYLLTPGQVTVTPFDTIEEVIEMANSVEYGLAASVWTDNVKRAHKVAQELRSGTVWVNTWLKVTSILASIRR